SDLGNKPLLILFLGSGLVFLLHSGLPLSSSSGLVFLLYSGLPSVAGEENKVNILKSINEGPFQMGMIKETLTKGEEGALHLGPERPRVYFDLSPEDKERYNVNIQLYDDFEHFCQNK
nr:integrase, catalytic region, zinc finger, CCHC-type, peptidase aspartic, catalytic [Tanacetum cinerariifolium]